MGEREDTDSERLVDENFGDYDEKPHVDIDLTFTQYDAVKQVLDYQLGPAVAREYDGGMLFMWGENVDESLLRDMADALNDYERQLADGGHYEGAEAARGAASWVIRANVEHPDGRSLDTDT